MKIGPVPLESFAHMAAFTAVAFAFMALCRFLASFITPFQDDDEILSKQNTAVGLRFAGLMGGLVIGMSGALYGDSRGFVQDLTTFALDGAIVTLALFIAMGLLHVFTLRSIPINSSLKSGSLAVGWVEAGAYVATGLVLNGVFSSGGENVVEGILYIFLGQAALMLAFWIYEALTPYNLIAEVKKGNTAVGLSVGSRLAAIGFILQASLQGDTADWLTDLSSFGIFFAFGMILLAAVDYLADVFFLPKVKIKDIMASGNVAAVAKLAGVRIAAAIVVASIM